MAMALPAVPGRRQGFILSESGILPPDGMAIFLYMAKIPRYILPRHPYHLIH